MNDNMNNNYNYSENPEKKGSNNPLIAIILIVLLLVAIGYIGYTKFFANDNNNDNGSENNNDNTNNNDNDNNNDTDDGDNNKNDEVSKIELRLENNKIVFYTDADGTENIISEYKCRNSDKNYECTLGAGQFETMVQKNKLIILRDGEKYILYNVSTSKVIFEGEIFGIEEIYEMDDSGLVSSDNFFKGSSNIKGYSYKENGKFGLLDVNGKKLTSAVYDEIGNSSLFGFTNETYSYIQFKKDNKWGLVSLKDGKEVVSNKYEAINIYNSNKFAVKINNKWSILTYDNVNANIDNLKKYDDLYLGDNYYLATLNKKVNLYDYDGNMIGNINLDAGTKSDEHSYLYGNYGNSHYPMFFTYDKNDSNKMIITIYRNPDGNVEFNFRSWTYNITTKQLTDNK